MTLHHLTWHIPGPTLRAYLAGLAQDADAWSVEAHLTSCESCRATLAAITSEDAERAAALDDSWAVLAGALPSQGRVRRGGRWREVRVLVASGPAARWAWLAACVLVLSFAAAAGASGISQVPWLGIVAPVVPLLGVAASYGSGLDDAYEVMATTPAGGLRLLLVRTAAVLVVTTPVAVIAGAVTGYAPGPWLLASLALTLLTLALGSVVGVERAAVVVGAGWLIVAGTAIAGPGQRVPAVLSPDAVPVLLVASVVAAIIVAIRRSAFNHLPMHHHTRTEAPL
jgi:anti-sigma factor RsiW